MGKLLQLQVQVFILIACCVFCWWKGGRAERWGAGLIFGANVFATIIGILTYPSFPYFVVFILDFALAVALLFLAIRYNSMWLGVAMILQGVELAGYAMQSADDGASRHDYARLVNILTALMLLSIVIGSLASWRRRINARRKAVAPRDAALA